MSALGQLLRGSFLQVAFQRLATPEFMDFVHRWKIDLDEVESLKETSAEIQVLSDEAEVKQFANKRVKLWLDRLKQLLYDAEDILDEFATEVQRLKLESEYQTHPHQTQQVRNPLPLTPSETSVLSLLNSGIGFGPQVYNVIEELQGKVRDINDRLKSVAQKGVALGLNPGMGSGSSRPGVFSQRTQTSSLVIQSNVFGREEDMWKIVGWLLSDKTPSHSHNGNNFSVLPIVGMGGSGKTTLAQLVYNHENLGNHFGLKAWVCVSENFDVLRLTKEILESATGSSSPNSESLDLLQRKLKETLSNKRFLLVLDDMWNEKYESWDALRTAFAFGKPGSKVLVTTRNKGVALMVHTDPDDQDHDIKGLSDEACIALVRRHAFRDENSDDANQKLEVFGEEIVKKCRGLALAVKTLAGLLRGKRDNSDWKDILENEIWDIRESEILPSLMLSYHHLPPLLKRCFAYCALFPKDHVFNKIELVMLWMAEGFVQPKGTKRLEDIGGGYFDELFMRSFFESSNRPLYHPALAPFVWQGGYVVEELFYRLSEKHHTKSFFESSNTDMESGFVMHDMIHDLAQFASCGIYCRREDDKPSEVLTTTTRHLSYFTNNLNVEAREFEVMRSLRSLLSIKYHGQFIDYSEQFLTTVQPQFQFLRVLCLRGYPNRELPDSIGKLKHLRLLDISFSDITKLPNSITSLYNLQTLLLVDCQSLRELPKDMGNLLNLRHIFLPTHTWLNYSRVSHMPLGVGKLTSLQTLSTFVVGSKNIMEMRHLSQLRGTLVISNLENVGNNGAQAMVADLKNKPHLLGLRLRWSSNRTSNDEKVEEDVLEQLQPHIKLEALWIEEYCGTGFPSWIGHPSFSNLKTVSLLGFRKCRFLPHLMQLPLLKHLEIHNCSAKKMVGSESYGEWSSSASKQFQSLEKLWITNMKEWEEWPDVVGQEEEGGGQFPCLRELSIGYCPKLRMFSHCFPALVILKIRYCEDLRELPQILPKLQELVIYDCPKLVILPSLPCIENLTLYCCEQITTLSNSDHPSSFSSSSATPPPPPSVHNSFHCLHKLHIECCPNLRELASVLPSLESLLIEDCKELCFLPNVPSIKELILKKCKGIVLNNKTVPYLSSLSSLTIDDVSDLESLPSGFIKHLTTLQNLKISHCTELTVLLQDEIGFDHLLPSSLRYLSIKDCDNLRMLLQTMCNLHCLEELIITGAKGLASLPEGLKKLTSLRVLEISNCENLESLPEELYTLMSLQRFEIKSLSAHVSFQEIGLLTKLQELRIIDCKNLEPPSKELHTLTSLQRFEIKSLPVLISFQETGLPIALQELSIVDCQNLESLPKELHTLTSLQQFTIRSCHALVSFQETMLPIALQRLRIVDCKNLESLPRQLHTLTSLQRFEIESLPVLISFQETRLPIALQELSIVDCKNLESLPMELHTLTSLQRFTIRSCHALVSFQESIIDCENLESLPMGLVYNDLMSLRSLVLHGYPNLKSLPEGLHKLAYLERLKIKECLALESFSDMGLPNGLQYLSISNCGKLRSLPKGLHKLTNLESLEIEECHFLTEYCKNLEPLQISGLHNLTTLRNLRISGCPALLSIPEGLLPTNLKEFCIENCPILEALPDELSDLFSLKHLSIQNCPMLTQRYQKKEGKEWFKIAHIPFVNIDGKWQY